MEASINEYEREELLKEKSTLENELEFFRLEREDLYFLFKERLEVINELLKEL